MANASCKLSRTTSFNSIQLNVATSRLARRNWHDYGVYEAATTSFPNDPKGW